jgi:hypothetical protein
VAWRDAGVRRVAGGGVGWAVSCMKSDLASGEGGSGPALPLTHSACPPRAAHPPLRLEVLHERRRLAHAGILSAGRGASHRIVLYSTWWRIFLLHCLLYSVVLYFIAFFRQGQAVDRARTLPHVVPTRSHAFPHHSHTPARVRTPAHAHPHCSHAHTHPHTRAHATARLDCPPTPSHTFTLLHTHPHTRPNAPATAGGRGAHPPRGWSVEQLAAAGHQRGGRRCPRGRD